MLTSRDFQHDILPTIHASYLKKQSVNKFFYFKAQNIQNETLQDEVCSARACINTVDSRAKLKK